MRGWGLVTVKRDQKEKLRHLCLISHIGEYDGISRRRLHTNVCGGNDL